MNDSRRQPLGKKIVRAAAFWALAFISPGLGNRASILMYHSVDRNGRFFAVAPSEFERQMNHLARRGYRVVPLREICTRLRNGEPIDGLVSLTFDDGYEDFYTNAFPVLKRLQLPATLFLTTGFFGTPAAFLKGGRLRTVTENQTKELAASGLIDVMPHSVTHRNLDQMPLEEAEKEIEESRAAIERLTGKPADVFAYPRGRFTGEVAGYFGNSGRWLGAVTVRFGLVRPHDGLFALRRNSVDSMTSFAMFRAYLSRAIDVGETMKANFRSRLHTLP